MSFIHPLEFYENESDFALKLLSTLPTNDSSVISPLSISLALSLVHLGAKGITKEQITQTILKGRTDEEFEEYFLTLGGAVRNSQDGVETQIANRIFVNEGSEIKPNYLIDAQMKYSAGAEVLNFGDSETSAKKINDFVAANTGNNIKDLITADTLKDAFALLVNAVYFKGEWQDKFEKIGTSLDNFHSSVTSQRNIPFLHEFETHRDFAEDDTFQVLSLRYSDTSYTFAIFLPKQRFVLKESLKKLNGTRFQSLINSLGHQYLNISIPKFKIEKSLDLKEALEKVGINEIFKDSADISDFADNVHISSGVHKALIEVDEDGTTAAASSALKPRLEMMIMADPIQFTADHPFVFALLKNRSPMFLGIHA